jgi:hypothetical protein
MRDIFMKPRVALFALVLMSLLLAGCAGTTRPVIVATQLLSPACPSSLTEIHIGSRPGKLVPSAPKQAVFCKYAGFNEKVKSGTLIHVVAVRNPSALAKLLNQARPVPKGAGLSLPVGLRWQECNRFRKSGEDDDGHHPNIGLPLCKFHQYCWTLVPKQGRIL